MIGHHGIYVLKVLDTIFYCGYCCNRPLERRLNEHIEEALFPSDAELNARLIRNEPTQKHQIIIAAYENNVPIEITAIHKAALYEEINEQHFIDQLIHEGHVLTNRAKGQVWQPYTFSKGRLTKRVKEVSKVKQPVEVMAISDAAYNAFYLQHIKNKLHRLQE